MLLSIYNGVWGGTANPLPDALPCFDDVAAATPPFRLFVHVCFGGSRYTDIVRVRVCLLAKKIADLAPTVAGFTRDAAVRPAGSDGSAGRGSAATQGPAR